ncbi:MAG: trypsin-like peptidase domain-containing protein [Sphingorhabdus sp.]
MLTQSAPLARFLNGAVVPVWDIKDMRLTRGLEQTIVYLFKDLPSAQSGDGDRGATGFWVYAETTAGRMPFIVTNRHVIEDGSTSIRFTSAHGYTITSAGDNLIWHSLSDNNADVAVAFASAEDVGHATGLLFPTTEFVMQDDIANLDIRFGDDVAMVGRHLNFDGKLTNDPTARFGHIVQFPGSPIQDERGRSHPAYLIQTPSLPGFSGSPVFLIQNEAEKERENSKMIFNKPARVPKLLGINIGHIPAYSPTYMASSGTRNEYVNAETNSGIIVVQPAWVIKATILDLLSKLEIPSHIAKY